MVQWKEIHQQERHARKEVHRNIALALGLTEKGKAARASTDMYILVLVPRRTSIVLPRPGTS